MNPFFGFCSVRRIYFCSFWSLVWPHILIGVVRCSGAFLSWFRRLVLEFFINSFGRSEVWAAESVYDSLPEFACFSSVVSVSFGCLASSAFNPVLVVCCYFSNL